MTSLMYDVISAIFSVRVNSRSFSLEATLPRSSCHAPLPAAFAEELKSGQERQRKVRKRTDSVASLCGEEVYFGLSRGRC